MGDIFILIKGLGVDLWGGGWGMGWGFVIYQGVEMGVSG